MAGIGRLPTSVRCFTTSAYLQGQLIKPPIAVFGLEGRYATALFSAASKQNVLDKVDTEVMQLQEAIKKDAKFSEYLESPIVKRESKKAVLGDILTKMKCSNVTSNFFGVLADNGRLKKVNAIIKSFQTIMGAHKGEVLAEVTTAKPLDAAQMKELNTALQSFLSAGQKLKLETKIEPSLIGGMTISIGDRYVDMSISSKVTKYEKLLKESV